MGEVSPLFWSSSSQNTLWLIEREMPQASRPLCEATRACSRLMLTIWRNTGFTMPQTWRIGMQIRSSAAKASRVSQTPPRMRMCGLGRALRSRPSKGRLGDDTYNSIRWTRWFCMHSLPQMCAGDLSSLTGQGGAKAVQETTRWCSRLAVGLLDLLKRLLDERPQQRLTGRRVNAVVAGVRHQGHRQQLRRPKVGHLQDTEPSPLLLIPSSQVP